MRIRALILVFLLAGCDSAPEPWDGPPLIVYAAYSDVDYLPSLFRAYTEATGVPVVVRHRSDEENVEDMLRKSGSSPADVLLTRSIPPIRDAAYEGLLRPLTAGFDSVDRRLVDPDGFWVAFSYDRLVVAGRDVSDANYAEPGEGRLCLSAAGLDQNVALIAGLIDRLGTREAELAVRRWVGRLAIPPLKDDAELLGAIRDQRCDAGIVRESSVTGNSDVPMHAPDDAFFVAEGLGVGRHARSPEQAQDLVRWMLDDNAQRRHALATRMRSPVARPEGLYPPGAAALANHADEARLLAERARYR